MARLCACPEISSESNSVQTLQKSFGWDYKPRSPVCIRMQKDHKHMCGKQQNNPACTKMCQSSQCWSWTLYKRRRRTMLTHWSQFVPNMSSRPVWVGRMRRKRTTGQHAEEKRWVSRFRPFSFYKMNATVTRQHLLDPSTPCTYLFLFHRPPAVLISYSTKILTKSCHEQVSFESKVRVEEFLRHWQKVQENWNRNASKMSWS